MGLKVIAILGLLVSQIVLKGGFLSYDNNPWPWVLMGFCSIVLCWNIWGWWDFSVKGEYEKYKKISDEKSEEFILKYLKK